MTIGIIGNNEIYKKHLTQSLQADMIIYWTDTPGFIHHAACYIDLQFEKSAERIQQLKSLEPAIIIVNSPCHTLQELPDSFTRINAWPTFLEKAVIEASSKKELVKPVIEKIFEGFGKKIEWTPDKPGFIAARVISMIINEAYLALEEGVSTKEEIDTAMKLGTNYPYGPFEWSKKIGLKNIYTLLETLSVLNKRYQPAPFLKNEALS
jgi:3-hydroxybutyryl-CoA dehydrogenase